MQSLGMTANTGPRPMTDDEEAAILIRLAQKYAPGNLPDGVSLGSATRAELAEAIRKGMRAGGGE